MADFPALPLWTDAYLADTMHMSVTESGAYLHLLMAAWRSPDCTLPEEDKMLGRMARCTPREWAKVRDVVMNFWTRDEKTKTWSQKRLLKEREYVRVTSGKAKHAADARWRKTNETPDAPASPEHVQEPASEHMPEPCSTDAPIPIPIKVTAAATRDPACDFIGIFDDVRTEVFGREQSRPWPEGSDLGTARKWMAAGVSLELARGVLLARMSSMKSKGRRPPGTLTYFDIPMMDALATSKQPLPEGHPNDDPLHIPDYLRRGKQPTKTDRAKAAVMRAAVAGGYAPNQPSGPAGAGDDNLSVFSVSQALREGTGGA